MSVTSSLLSVAKRPVKEVLKRRMLAGAFSPTVTIGARDPRRAQVFMCLYNRPDRIRRVLELLAGQSNVEGVDLHLWNNNRRDHAVYERAVREFGSTGALRSVRRIRSPFNLGSNARFYPVRQLGESGDSGPIPWVGEDGGKRRWGLRDLCRAGPWAALDPPKRNTMGRPSGVR